MDPKFFGSNSWESLHSNNNAKNKLKTKNEILLLLQNLLNPNDLNVMDILYKTARYIMDDEIFINRKNRSSAIDSLFKKKNSSISILNSWIGALDEVSDSVINRDHSIIPPNDVIDNLILRFCSYKRLDLKHSIKILNSYVNDRNIAVVPFYKFLAKSIFNSLITDTCLYTNVTSTHLIYDMRKDGSRSTSYFLSQHFHNFDSSQIQYNNKTKPKSYTKNKSGSNSNSFHFKHYNNKPKSKFSNQSNHFSHSEQNQYSKNSNPPSTQSGNNQNSSNDNGNIQHSSNVFNSPIDKIANEVNLMMNKIGQTYSKSDPECAYFNKGICSKSADDCTKLHCCTVDKSTAHGLHNCPTYLAA